MLAAAVGVDARIKADIRAVVVGDDALGRIVEKLCQGRRCLVVVVRQLRDSFDCFEAILGIAGRSSAAHSTRSLHRIYPAAWGGAGAAAAGVGAAGAAPLAAAASLVSCARWRVNRFSSLTFRLILLSFLRSPFDVKSSAFCFCKARISCLTA